MNLWKTFEIQRNIQQTNQGIAFHYHQNIDSELKQKYIAFAKWLRRTYIFPVRISVYVLNCEKVTLQNGTMAYGSFRWFPKRKPLIRIPSAIEPRLLLEYTKEEIFEQILSSLVHELTHYYQWVLKLEQNNVTSERQASYYRYRILDKFNNETTRI